MLCLRLVMFSVVYFWHNQIQSAALATKPLPQCSNVTIRNNPTTAATTSNASSINNAGAAALLSQRNQSKADFSHEHTDHASDISTKMPTSSSEELLAEKKEFKDSINPCAQRAQEFAESRILAEQLSVRADHNETLKKERAHIRIKKEIEAQIKAEKEIADQVESLRNEIEQDQIKAEIEIQEEILQQFNDIQDTAFTTIESEITRPAQWGDYFPITKSFFVYIGWREEETVVAEREQLKAEQQAKRVACKEIASLIAIAIAGFDDDQKKHLESLINSNIDCDQFSDKKETAPNENIQYNYRSNKNASQDQKNGSSKQPIQSNNAVRLDDVMDQGIKYKQYVFVDDNGQYSTGYLESYDSKHCSVFSFSEPIDIQPSKASQGIQQFHNYHERSVVNMKYNHHRNSPVTQRGQVDALFNLKRISREDAIQYYKQIEYAEKLATARAAARQFEKAQHPGFVKKYINSWSGKTSPAQPTHTTNPTPPTSKSTLPAQPNTTSPSGPTSTTTQTSAPTHSSTRTTPTHPTPSSINSTPLPTNKAAISQAEQDLLASMIYNSSQIPTQSPSPDTDENMAMHCHEELEKAKILDRQKLLEAQDEWMQNVHISNVDPKDNNMIQYMLNVIVAAKNDTTIEIAQSGLRAWQEAQNAQTEESRKYYVKKSQLYYNAIQNKTPIQSIAQQAQSIKTVELDNLLQDYNAAIKMHADEQNANPYQTKNPHFDRLEKRAQALSTSKKQLRIFKALPQRSYKISPQARDFMMANNMNYATFDEILHFTEYQHCLTQEILEIIESSVNMAQNHDAESTIGKIALENCNLAISAQQLNQTSRIKQATAITDFCHFFDAYAEFLHNSKLYSPIAVNIHVGFMEGTVRALWAWKNFIENLICQPRQTIGKITHDCQAVGTCLYNVVAKAHEFMPSAYLNDMMQDMQQNIANMQNNENTANPHDASRMMQRTQRNAQFLQNGLYGGMQAAQSIIEEMMKKSLRQNVAVGTEIIIDNMITSKATDLLLKLSSLVGNQALKLGNQVSHNLPPHLKNAPVHFVETTTGELMLFSESTGENIGAAMATQCATNNTEQIIKNTVKAKELTKKIDELTKPDPKEVEAFQKSVEPYLNSEKIINVERLQSIEGVDQIKRFKDYTKNFTELEKLTPDEILYLNLCDWLERRSSIINEALKKKGGMKFVDVAGVEGFFEEYDLFHSLLGEMSPEAVANRISGGHLFIPELKTALLDIGEIKPIGNGFFDMSIKYAGKASEKYKPNSYFPAGTSVEQAVEMIEDALLNIEKIKNVTPPGRTDEIIYEIQNYKNKTFKLHIKNKNNVAHFYPFVG